MITFSHNKLKAALLCAPSKERRSYLNGVRIEFDGTRECLLVGTDGLVLFAGQLMVQPDAPVPAFAITVPFATCKQALASRGVISLQQRDEATWQLGAVVFAPLDGSYPDWRQVIPREHTPTPDVQYPWDQLDQVRTALATWHNVKTCTPTIVRQAERGASVATAVDSSALVGITPLRTSYIDKVGRPQPFL